MTNLDDLTPAGGDTTYAAVARLPTVPVAMLPPASRHAIEHARRLDEYRARALARGFTAEAWRDQVDRLTRWAHQQPHVVDVPAAAFDLLLHYGAPVDPEHATRDIEAVLTEVRDTAASIEAALTEVRVALRPVFAAFVEAFDQVADHDPRLYRLVHGRSHPTIRRMHADYRRRQMARRRNRNRRR